MTDNISSFKNLRIVDNFYQTSAFYPMPTIMISTLCEDGATSLGSYSLCFPYYVAGKDYYAMLLCCRNNSNTAKALLRTNKCALNFIPDERRYFKEAVRLGYPGDKPGEKMKGTIFELEEGLMARENPDEVFPEVVSQAFQVFECTWMKELDGAGNDIIQESYEPPYHDFNGITSETGAHFILRVDRILMKEEFQNTIINGSKRGNFPSVPVDYGYRDNSSFWYMKHRRPLREPIPEVKGIDVSIVMHASERINPEIRFTEEACSGLVKVPRVFLNRVLTGCVDWAKENGVTLITSEHMTIINDKRSRERRGG